MSTNMNKLRGKMVENRISHEALSRQIGMHPATFSRKMQSEGESFTVGEMHKIVDVLHLSHDEAAAIFLW